ncbi:MAG TPA: caspase family protein [Thermoanaerobaculia bacterium]|nr:caspase family protein [Thermoanaerobaculia bacterium]
MTSEPENVQKWALVVGIDRYEHLDPRYYLEGCVNDAQAMAAVLKDQFQFPAENVTLLLDGQATQKAILHAMRDLARNKVGPDDIVVFHYSGHGSQRTDGPERDEDDGRDETILAYDARREGPDSAERDAPNVDISDDDIHAWLLELKGKTRYVTLIFDCCHSGTVARLGPRALESRVRVRWVEPDLRPYAKLRPALYAAAVTRGEVEGLRRSGPSGWLPEDRHYTLLAGCRSQERSYEVRLHEGEVSAHGAFTFYLLQALQGATAGNSYRDIFEQAASRVTADFPTQHPQLEGARERQLFGPIHLEPMRFVAVEGREGKRVTLAAGAACGMAQGALWAVYPPGTRDPEQTAPLGRVQVRSARAVTSEAEVIEEAEPGTIGPLCRAVEQVHDFNKHLTVSVAGFAAAARWTALVEQEIERSPLLRLLRRVPPPPQGAPQVRVELRPPSGPVHPTYPVQGAVWRAVHADSGELVMPEIDAAAYDAGSRVAANLERKVRYDNVRKLKNPGSALAGKIEMILLRQRWEDWVEMPPSEAVLADGERFAIEVRNHHDQPVYVQILDLGLLKGIDLVHPVEGGCDAVPPGGSFQIAVRAGDELYLRVPEEFPFHCPGESPASGDEVLMLFAATRETDLSLLLQGRMRDATSTGTSLAVQFAAALGAARSFREVVRQRGQEDWTVIERSITVERWR